MSNGNIYDPTAQVGTAIAERKYKKTQADIERRKEWAKTGRDSVWELAKAGSKFQRERMNAKMFGAKVPGLEGEVSMYKLKTHDSFLDAVKNKVYRTEESYELTGSAERYLADLEKGKGTPEGLKALEDLIAEYPDIDPAKAGEHFKMNMRKGKSVGKSADTVLASDKTSLADGGSAGLEFGPQSVEEQDNALAMWQEAQQATGSEVSEKGISKAVSAKGSSRYLYKGGNPASWGDFGKVKVRPSTGLAGKGMAGLQVGTGLYSLANPKSTTNQQLGGAAQVALGVNAGLQAFGLANAWNPVGLGSLAASFGASLFQSGAFG